MLLLTALFDLELHRSQGDGRTIEQVFEDVQREMPHLRLSGYHRFAFGFDYLVTGYEASVYAYKWSGVLATEAFKRFEHDGVFNPQTGKAFRQAILARGGSKAPMELFKDFRGREPSIDALLRHSGLTEGSAA